VLASSGRGAGALCGRRDRRSAAGWRSGPALLALGALTAGLALSGRLGARGGGLIPRSGDPAPPRACSAPPSCRCWPRWSPRCWRAGAPPCHPAAAAAGGLRRGPAFALDGTAAEGLDALIGPVMATGLAAFLLGRE
jgi:hypothetical protein